MGILIGAPPAFGDGGEGSREVSGIVDEPRVRSAPIAGHLIEQRLREEAGRLRDGESDVRARDGIEGVPQASRKASGRKRALKSLRRDGITGKGTRAGRGEQWLKGWLCAGQTAR